MKHLESFKDIFKKKPSPIKDNNEVYKEGDYLLVNSEGEHGDYLYYVKVLSVDKTSTTGFGPYWYTVFICLFTDGSTSQFKESSIERRLTDKEIEDYDLETINNKIEQDANKYNI